ncbi:MAG: biopolymer transporter ExbD [Phycisphaeraceae bacterium]|nr:biopolymer transporter ExbD [Phycisphaeraceae bacterium]
MKFLRRAANSRRPPTLPVTSLIDCVFLLLIYFLVTARMTNEEGRLTASLAAEKQGAGSGRVSVPQVVSVETGPDGGVRFRIGERTATDRESLRSVLGMLTVEEGVFIKVSSAAPVAGAADALQAAKDAGFTRINYVPAK